MRILSIILLLFLFSQKIYSERTSSELEPEGSALKPHQLEQLTITDLWNRVKNRAIRAWESLKDVADRSGKRISQWMKNIKTKAKKLNAFFKSRIQKMRKEVSDLIASVKNTSDLVKRCLQEQQAAIDKILKEILQDVTACISKNIQSLSLLETNAQSFIEKTEFVNKVERKLSLCLNNDDIEQCFDDVRINVYEDLEREEKEMLTDRDELRAKTDDILDTITTCTSNGLIASSAAITNTTIYILKCVSKG